MPILSITNKTKLAQWLRSRAVNALLKLLIVTLLLVAIYFQVFARENALDLWLTFRQRFTVEHLPYLLAVLVLVPVNWGFEAYKWQTLIRGFSSLSFQQTYRAILAGVAFSLFTPNRVGEVGGRILLVEPAHNWQAAVATMVGSLSQLIVLLSMGFLGVIYFVLRFVQQEFSAIGWVLTGGTLLVGVLIYGFFNLKKLSPLVRYLPYRAWIKKRFGRLQVLLHYERKQLSVALLFSFFRYLTYSFQYFLILYFFGIEVSLVAALSGIATIFLLQTSIPLPPLVGILARGEIALGVWGIFSPLSLNILAASFSLFIINLILPALLGAFFIIQINVLNSLGFDKRAARDERRDTATRSFFF